VRDRGCAAMLRAIGLDKPGGLVALFRRKPHALKQAGCLPGLNCDSVLMVKALHDARCALSETAITVKN
jgi:hypothetical protein